jgi:hypothetical protein
MSRRTPDLTIGGGTDGDDYAPAYMHRWYVTPWRRFADRHSRQWWRRWLAYWPNIYLHVMHRSDEDRALHDHPWPSLSLVLAGGYWEWQPVSSGGDEPTQAYARVVATWRPAGSIPTRSASTAHRIELDRERPAVSLFVTGIRRRQVWGFHCPEGWRSSADFERNGGCD